MPDNRRAAQPFQDADLDFLRTERDEPVEPGPKTFQCFTGQTDDQIRVDVNAGFAAQKIEIIRQPFTVLPAADERADFGIERLDANLELQRAGREPGDDLAQFGGQPVGNHLKMIKMAGLMAREEKFEDGPAGGDVQIERAVHELELFHAPVEQLLHLVEKSGQGNLPHRNIERRQAKFAGERAAARCLDVNDAMREIVVGVKVVRQDDFGKVRHFGGNDFGKLRVHASACPPNKLKLELQPKARGTPPQISNPPRR